MAPEAIIDRFEGDFAILLLGDEEIRVDWPRRYLPDEAEEGSILRIDFGVDTEKTEARRAEMQRRIDRLRRRSR